MEGLKAAFEAARQEKSILPVFDPFIAAKLFVIGALDGNGRPNIALKSSPGSGRWCATVSERAEWMADVPESRKLPITGAKLVQLLEDDTDIVVVYQSGGDLLQHEYVAAFSEALA